MIYFLTELNSLGAGALITEGNAVKLDERLHVCATRAYRSAPAQSSSQPTPVQNTSGNQNRDLSNV